MVKFFPRKFETLQESQKQIQKNIVSFFARNKESQKVDSDRKVIGSYVKKSICSDMKTWF